MGEIKCCESLSGADEILRHFNPVAPKPFTRAAAWQRISAALHRRSGGLSKLIDLLSRRIRLDRTRMS